MHEIKDIPFRDELNFAKDKCYKCLPRMCIKSENQLPFDFLSRFVPSLPTKPGFQTGTDTVEGITRIKLCYKRGDLRDRQFGTSLYKRDAICCNSK